MVHLLGLINKILAEKYYIFVIVYLHNIVIFIKNKSKKHIEHILLVFYLLKKNRFLANLEKC